MRISQVRRRKFIALLGGAGVAWPLAARGQQSGMPVVGYLEAGLPEALPHRLAAFRKGLSETGYVEGQNVAIEYRWAQDQYDRLPELAADLVRRRVAASSTPVSAQGSLAAQGCDHDHSDRLQHGASIRSRSVSSPASTGLAATSLVSAL